MLATLIIHFCEQNLNIYNPGTLPCATLLIEAQRKDALVMVLNDAVGQALTGGYLAHLVTLNADGRTFFQWYLKYASYLDVMLRDLFEMALRRAIQERESDIQQKEAPFVKEEVLRRVEEAIQRLNSLKLPVTQKSVMKIVGLASVEMFKEQIAAMIRDEHVKQVQASADKLFGEVQSAIKQLEGNYSVGSGKSGKNGVT